MIHEAQWRKLCSLQYDLLAHCGDSEGFGQLYLEAIGSYVPIDNCATFLITDAGAEHIFTHGKLSPAVANSLAKNYLGLFHKDPSWQDLSGISSQKILWHMLGSSYGSLYKYHFFERTGLVDKVARVEHIDEGVCSCYIYRRTPSQGFSTQDIAMLELVLPVFTAAVAMHCRTLLLRRRNEELLGRMQAQGFTHSIEGVLRDQTPPLDGLTKRERQVCELIFKGQPLREIAEELGLSVNSVATYRQRAYSRLSISKIQELFALLFEAVENRRASASRSPQACENQ